MRTISRCFNHICTQNYKSLGFSRLHSTFIRRKKDILQVFSLKCSQSLPICSVEFGIFPLCLPQPVYFDAGGYMLDEFIVDLHGRNSGWTFDASSDESIMNCIESISQALDLYLMPFFEACSDCNTSLAQLVWLEELFDRNRKKTLYLRGDSDAAAPWQERSLFDSRKYYMALKARNLPYAQQYLIHQIDFYKNRLKSFDASSVSKQPTIVRERFSAKLALCVEQLERIESGDFSYFDDLLNFNENKMDQFLATKYPRLRYDK